MRSIKKLDWMSLATAILVRLVIYCFALFVTYYALSRQIKLYSIHIICMSIGYVILMTESVLCFNHSDPNAKRLKTHKKRVFWHWLLQAIALVFIVTGFLTIIFHKINKGQNHFVSNHAIYGLGAIIMSALSVCGGIAAKYSMDLRNWIRPVYNKIWHAFFGATAYGLAIVSLVLSLYTNWITKELKISAPIWWMWFIGLLFVGCWVLFRPLLGVVSRVRNA